MISDIPEMMPRLVAIIGEAAMYPENLYGAPPTTSSVGIKHDAGKLRWDLLPWEQVEEVVKVLTDGEAKYGVDNWKKLDKAKRRLIAATQRHIVAYIKGEANADDTGSSHLSHAVCSLLMLMWHQKQHDAGGKNV